MTDDVNAPPTTPKKSVSSPEQHDMAQSADASPVSDSDTHASHDAVEEEEVEEDEEEKTNKETNKETNKDGMVDGEKESKEDDAVKVPKKVETAEEARIRREKYKDWPLKNIEEPHDNDVLYGRGGGTNHHPGNKRYRQMVEERKIDYVNSKRLDKPLVALEIIREWRSQEPPGRFLKLDERTKKWNDVGDKKSREKTSQALREKAPLIRKKQEEQRKGGQESRMDEGEDMESGDDEEPTKSTRFADGTNLNDGAREGGISKAVLARDHSLGREYLEPDEAMTLDGFSWQDPFRNGAPTNSPGAADRVGSGGSLPPPGGFHPSIRVGSQGSMNGSYYRYPSQGSVGPPMPPPGPGGYTHYRSGEERHFRYTASGRYESWGSTMPPPMSGYPYPQASECSWAERDHSLGQNPLPHASVGHPAPYSTFDPHSRAASGQWGPPLMPPQGPNSYPSMSGPPPYGYSGGPPPPHYPPREYSGGHPVIPSPTRGLSPTSSSHSPSSPRFEVDPKVASTWSGQKPGEISKSWSESSSENADRFLPAASSSSSSSRHRKSASSTLAAESATIPKPDFIKRNTSHQNETVETKPDLKGPSVKRAALNRDNSLASNRLKEQYLPDYYQLKKFNDELLKLSDDFEQSTLGEERNNEGPAAPLKPNPLSKEHRTSTVEQIAMELMVRPEPLFASARSSTIEALALDFDDDPLIRPDMLSRGSSIMSGIFVVDKPPAWGPGDRLSTNEALDLVTGPISDDDMELLSGNRQSV